ncbi:MAG: DUF1810 domain-containing protein [Hyphomicrobiaceae bacterium]|nr:DUF1810 domain-containing protein [Hyphomicrobiaceae bacterium]
MSTTDRFDLDRFVAAQDGIFERACAEMAAGRKQSHWMWFVFPQLRGLGTSVMAERYGIASLAEAQAYLAHPVTGPHLARITVLVLEHRGTSLRTLFGTPDDLKFQSSMTLFEAASTPESVYAEAIAAMCGGRRDERTLRMIGKGGQRA